MLSMDDSKNRKPSNLTSDDLKRMKAAGITIDDLKRMESSSYSYPANVGGRGEFAPKKFARKIALLHLGVYLREEDNKTFAQIDGFQSSPQYWVLSRDAPKIIEALVRHFIISNGVVRSGSQTEKKDDLSKGVKLDHS